MHLAPPAFVLERRINTPLALVNRAVSTGGPFVAAADLSLGWDGAISFDTPLRRTLGSFDLAWRAHARLLTRHGRPVARVALTVDGWSGDSTRLQLRPAAPHPERWSRRRLRRYFRVAHLAADRAARELDEHSRDAPTPPASRAGQGELTAGVTRTVIGAGIETMSPIWNSFAW